MHTRTQTSKTTQQSGYPGLEVGRGLIREAEGHRQLHEAEWGSNSKGTHRKLTRDLDNRS
jgi:hypothetical protein